METWVCLMIVLKKSVFKYVGFLNGPVTQPALWFIVMFLVSDYEAIVKLSDGFNGADLRNVCTEAGENST